MRATLSEKSLSLREEHREATRRRIVRGLLERLAEDHPAEISIPAVARQAGVSVATLYRYFPSKEELLDAAAQYGQELVDYAPLDVFSPAGYLRSVFHQLLELWPMVLAQHSSPAGRELRRRRAAGRLSEVEAQLGRLADRVSPAGLRRLQTLVLLLISSSSLLELHDHCGLAADEAGEQLAWAIQATSAATIAESSNGSRESGGSEL